MSSNPFWLAIIDTMLISLPVAKKTISKINKSQIIVTFYNCFAIGCHIIIVHYFLYTLDEAGEYK